MQPVDLQGARFPCHFMRQPAATAHRVASPWSASGLFRQVFFTSKPPIVRRAAPLPARPSHPHPLWTNLLAVRVERLQPLDLQGTCFRCHFMRQVNSTRRRGGGRAARAPAGQPAPRQRPACAELQQLVPCRRRWRRLGVQLKRLFLVQAEPPTTPTPRSADRRSSPAPPSARPSTRPRSAHPTSARCP